MVKRTKNMEAYYQSNYYKLIHKVMGSSTTIKERSKHKKISALKLEILAEFINMPRYKFRHVQQVLMLSKINGIYLTEGSFTDEGKKVITDSIQENIPRHKLSQDDFSQTLLNRYISTNEQSKRQTQNDSEIQSSRITTNDSVQSQQIMSPTLTKIEEGSRFDIRISLPEGNDVTTLRTILQQIIHKLTEVDTSVTFIPWFSNEINESMPFNVVPDSLWEINKFFPRIKATKSGPTYGEFRMIHSKPYQQIIEEMSTWLYEPRHAIYYQALQSQLTTNLGWLLWSFRNIDTHSLQQELYKLYNIQTQLRFQNIALNKKGNES